MSNVSLHQLLVLYTWFPLAVLLSFLLLIGRFYQKFSGERTYFWFYLPCAILFGALFVRLASMNFFQNDLLANGLSVIAGALLLFLSLLLYFRMMRHKDDSPL